MKPLLRILLLALLSAAAVHAQWQTTTYPLKAGWNGIWLHGDATHATPEQLLASLPAIEEVWRWNPNPQRVGFISTPLQPTPGTPEWSVWRRGSPEGSDLLQFTGQAGYLIKVAAGSVPLSLALTQRLLPPRNVWVRNGANLLAFPTRKNGAAYPTFSSYFGTFPAATSGKIYRYAGGALGPANPLQILSTSAERIDRDQAYWFEAQAVEDFTGPVEVMPGNPAGLSFGRLGSLESLHLRNRTTLPQTITLQPLASEAAPSGQEPLSGAVPLTVRAFDAASASTIDSLLAGPITRVIPPGGTLEVQFGLDRSRLTGAENALAASLLRVTDAANMIDVLLPVTARRAGFSGLWIGDAEVTHVVSTVPGSPGSTTARGFPLRYLIHVDQAGTARILSQVFAGTLAVPGNPHGLAVRESALKSDARGSAARFVSTHLPLDRTLTAAGAFGGALTCTFSLPFDDPTSPFVHQYHPDHDNRSARFQPLPAGVESFNVSRAISFAFSGTPPAGQPAAGWGTTVVGGTYSETLTGLHRRPLTVTGTFLLRRVTGEPSITLE